MRLKRIARLALGEAGWSPWRGWPLAAGLALGVATWIFLVGYTGGVGQLIRDKVSGTLPDRVRVAATSTSIGPISLQGGLSEDSVEACKKIPGVVAVYRQAHFPGPVQLHATYGGQSMVTDIILEGVDPAQVSDQVSGGAQAFADSHNLYTPVVIPEAVLDVLNAGISAHTSLPTLSAAALIGKDFRLLVGTSSFQPGNYVDAQCHIVGVTDQLGVTGPAVPLEWLRRNSTKPLSYHTLTLQLAHGTPIEPVIAQVEKMGLTAPGFEMAQRISSFVEYTRWATTAFSVAILLVAGIGISTGISLQVREEKATIGLLRALGATRRDITTLFVIRAGLLGTTGALAGLSVGLASGILVQAVVRHSLGSTLHIRGDLFQPGLDGVLLSLFFAIAVSLVSGLLPARQAAGLSPAQVLRGD